MTTTHKPALPAPFTTLQYGTELFDADQLRAYGEACRADERARMLVDGWRLCAQGQRTTQWCGQLEAAVADERERCAEALEGVKDPWITTVAASAFIRALGEKS